MIIALMSVESAIDFRRLKHLTDTIRTIFQFAKKPFNDLQLNDVVRPPISLRR